MPETAEVIVIGGGVVGVCSAYFLAEHVRGVIVIEKGDICSGCSYGNAGLILPSHSVPFAAPGAIGTGMRWMFNAESPFYIKPRLDPSLLLWLWRLKAASSAGRMRSAIPVIRQLHLASMALYNDLAVLSNLDFGYERTGVLALFNNRHAFKDGIEETRFLGQYGICTKILDPPAVLTMAPHVLPDVSGGIFYPEDAHLNPAAFVTGLARAARDRGVRFQTQTEVRGFETNGKHVKTIQTTQGDFRATEVVLASGSWSPGVARNLGLRLPIQPAKGYSITVKRPATCPAIPLNLKEARVTLTPMGDTMRLTGMIELAGLDFSINRTRVDAILKSAQRYVDGLDALEVIEIWRGLRPCTPDGLPILGRSAAYENLIIAAGHATIGMCLGPITGKLVSELARREKPCMDLTLLEPARFGL